MILSPDEYRSAAVEELLDAAARGHVGLDQRWVRALIERGDAALAAFAEWAERDREGDRVDLSQDLLDIARAMRSPAALPLYGIYARRAGFELPDPLTEAYSELGGLAIEALLELERESGGAPDVRFALSALGAHDPRILRILTGYLEEDPADASLALSMYGDPAARVAVSAALVRATDETTRLLLTQVSNELQTVRPPREPERFELGELYPEQADPWFAALDDSELLQFLNSPVAGYRAGAVRMLAFDVPPPRTAARLLEIARTDPDVGVRAAAWESLEGVEEPAEVPEAVERRAWDETAPEAERAAALVAIAGRAKEDERLRARILEYFGSEETRVQAVKAMWHSGDRWFEPQVIQALDDRDTEVLRQAVTAVGLFGMVGQIGRLERLFDTEELRSAALYAYALAAPGEVSPGHMRTLFRKIEERAGGLDEEEGALVAKALDDRLEMNGLEPVFLVEDGEAGDEPEDGPPAAPAAKPGRNDPCPCGSGKKYKKCCGA